MREDGSRILPILALNEVFIGESLSSRVSYLELQVTFVAIQKMFDMLSSSRVDYPKDCDNLHEKVDQQQPFKTRNSGLCIATGTGEQDLSPKIHHSTSNLIRSGSTSWIFNVNKMAHHAVESLLKITFETTRSAELIYSYGEVIEEALRQVPPELEGPQVG